MAATIPCPICKKPVPFDDPNMPFCSDRCRLLDLGNWAAEKYRIEGAKKDALDDLEESEPVEGSRQ
ncbi:MAG: DNA gyrase inhibitor YacG [Acidobacteriaceae bacterium]|nr:DNA gyrase inhibitor YacG [Acidobacteriaceae bacterium]